MVVRLRIERPRRTLALALSRNVAPDAALGRVRPTAVTVGTALPWLPSCDNLIVARIMNDLDMTHEAAEVFLIFEIVI